MTVETAPSARPETWWRLWLAALPVLPFLSVAGLAGWSQLNTLSSAARAVLVVYVLCQQLAALFTPAPLLSSLLALARSALMLGLIGLGARWASTRFWPPLGLGLVIVFGVALLSTLTLPAGQLLTQRLAHPYYTPISLGVAGVFGVWLALFTRGARAWRWALGLVGLLVLLLSGSRGPLLMLAVGTAAGLLTAARARTARLMALSLALGVVLIGLLPDAPVLSRLTSTDATSRDVVWQDTLSVLRAHPVGGVGPYRLGAVLAPPGGACHLWDALESRGYVCPAWLAQAGQPWLIAHNSVMQQLAESGVIGTFGLFLLLGTAAVGAVARRDPLVVSVVIGLLVGNLNDNVTLLPSPFFAEAFWLATGAALRDFAWPRLSAAISTGAMVLAVSAFPLVAAQLPPPTSNSPRLVGLDAERQLRPGDQEPYVLHARLLLAPGTYRVLLRDCPESCVTTAVQTVAAPSGGETDVWLSSPLSPQAVQRLQLRVLRGTSPPWAVTPLLSTEWSVRREAP